MQEPVSAFHSEGTRLSLPALSLPLPVMRAVLVSARLNNAIVGLSGGENTLLDVLQQMLPEYYSGESAKQPPQAIIQGVLPPLNTPILWLWYSFSLFFSRVHSQVSVRSKRRVSNSPPPPPCGPQRELRPPGQLPLRGHQKEQQLVVVGACRCRAVKKIKIYKIKCKAH
jgi:hypothetical protein